MMGSVTAFLGYLGDASRSGRFGRDRRNERWTEHGVMLCELVKGIHPSQCCAFSQAGNGFAIVE
jgi:hypothetical protein